MCTWLVSLTLIILCFSILVEAQPSFMTGKFGDNEGDQFASLNFIELLQNLAKFRSSNCFVPSNKPLLEVASTSSQRYPVAFN